MKSPLRRLAVSVAALGMVWFAGHRAPGYSWFQYGGVDVVWPGAQSVRYLSPSTFPPGSTPHTHYLAATGLWNLVPACDFVFYYADLAEDWVIDPLDGISYTAAVPASSLDPGVLGATYMGNSGAQWYDMDQVFSDLPDNVGWTFDPNPGYEILTAPTPSNGYSFLLVATHELGHALGLGHSPFGDEPPGTPWLIANMNPRYPAGGTMGQNHIIELHTDDRSGARYLYPHSGPSGPPMTDLAGANYSWGDAVGQGIPVFFEPPAVEPGAELTLRSVIENFGTTSEFYVRQGFYLSTDQVIDTDDLLIGTIEWDLAFEDAIDFDVTLDLLADLPAGAYYVGSIFDDLDQVAEEYEDNNAVVYHETLTVNQLVPVINEMDQQIVACGGPFVGPTPTLTHPLNMSPVTWSLDNPEPGMTVDPDTGVVSWPEPVRSQFLYTIYLRATNDAGSSTQILFLGVEQAAPQISPIENETVYCDAVYTGPTPTVTSPECMDPILYWTLVQGPSGLEINHSTGLVTWVSPLPSAQPYTITIRAVNAVDEGITSWQLTYVGGGDYDGDGDVDLNDFATFALCYRGPSVTTPPHGCSEQEFSCSDFDGDGDADLADFATFALRFTS